MRFIAPIFILSLLACNESPKIELQRKTPISTAEISEEPESESSSKEDASIEKEAEKVEEILIKNSGGAGGPIGMNEVNFIDSDQVSSSYKINVPADASEKVYGLHVHFHGDGGGGYTDFPNVETRNGLIGVTIKAPNPNLQWGRAQGVQHAKYAQELIQNEILKKYNIDLDKIYFSGVSGGAYFLSGSFLPEFGLQYKTGAFLMCGGEAPRTPFKDPALLKEFRIHWQVTAGERADITQSVQQSVEAYKTALTNIQDSATMQSIETKGTGGHCEFFEMAYTPGIQAMIDANFKIIIKP